jgi:hypothetical protein
LTAIVKNFLADDGSEYRRSGELCNVVRQRVLFSPVFCRHRCPQRHDSLKNQLFYRASQNDFLTRFSVRFSVFPDTIRDRLAEIHGDAATSQSALRRAA